MGLAVSKHEAFWEACGYGHTDKVKQMIDGGINVDWKGYTHESCAIHVASQGKADIVSMLIEANCNVNVVDGRGSIALHHAAMRGHVDIMQALVDAGSNLDTQNENGWTPLLNAAYWCQPEAVEILIRNKCDINVKNKDERTALQEACRSQHKDDDGLARITVMLLEAGADVNMKARDVQDEADFTPLIFAAFHGHPKVAQVLIDAKCDIDTQTSNKWTALHWAADQGHEEVVKVLLAAGANPNIQGRRSELAIDRAKTESIRALLRASSESIQHPSPPPAAKASPTPERGIRRSGSKMSSSEFVKFLLSPTAITLPDSKPTVNGSSNGAIEFMDNSSDEEEEEEKDEEKEEEEVKKKEEEKEEEEEVKDGGVIGDGVGDLTSEDSYIGGNSNEQITADAADITNACPSNETTTTTTTTTTDSALDDDDGGDGGGGGGVDGRITVEDAHNLSTETPVVEVNQSNDTNNSEAVADKIDDLDISQQDDVSNGRNDTNVNDEVLTSSDRVINGHVEDNPEDNENEAAIGSTDDVAMTTATTTDLDEVSNSAPAAAGEVVESVKTIDDRRFEESNL